MWSRNCDHAWREGKVLFVTVMALVSERTHLEALPAPDEPLLSWSVYLTGTPAKWLGTVEAATPEEAFAEAAEKFKQPKDRLMAVRRA